MSEVEVKKEKLKELILKCKEGIDKISYDEKNLKSNSFVLDVNRLPFQKEEIEEVLIQLFKTEIENEKGEKVPLVSLKDMKKIGIPNAMIDSVSAKIWFSDSEIQFIASMPDDYTKAITIIGKIYSIKDDRSGYPQSKHLISVSEALDTYEGKVAGLLHDVVEDGYLTLGSLCNIFCIAAKPVHIVDILTRDKDLYPTYASYIFERVLPSDIIEVLKIKLADMLNNQSEERVKYLPTEEQRHKASTKYKPYIPMFKSRIRNMEKCKLKRKRRLS